MNLDSTNHCSEPFRSTSALCDPYEPSIASTSLSSRSSVFSDTLSAQSSIASSISDDFRYTQEDAREQDRVCAQVQLNLQSQDRLSQDEAAIGRLLNGAGPKSTLSYADVTSAAAPDTHPNPRRCSLPRPQRPPPLVRQRDRKVNFVENLVDSATQMIEVIWPLSTMSYKAENGTGRGVLPLRTYIEETLRRSRTSYSTLQVALYYLILIRPYIPNGDFTKEQQLDCAASRALMCGRRMFLAALILASKYLQDRNYSAKAWSRMSGLRINEINSNERIFLDKINWKLHIPKPTFELWQEIVLRYTPQPPASPQLALHSANSPWKAIIPSLSPDLDSFVGREHAPFLEEDKSPRLNTFTAPATPTPSQHPLQLPALESTSQESTPTPSNVLPRFLEPTPDLVPPTPALARMGPLPTPQMTPSSVASSTPAVSACGSRRGSMCSAMALAQRALLSRCSIDTCPKDMAHVNVRRPPSRSQASVGSSPESLMSDRSQFSRSSSVSSAITVPSVSSVAPPRAGPARSATSRLAQLSHCHDTLKEEDDAEAGSHARPIVIMDDEMEIVASPEVADFHIPEKVHAPHRHSKHGPTGVATPASAEKSRKRCRARPTYVNHHIHASHSHSRRSELQEEVRYMLQESLDDAADEREEMDVDSDEYGTVASSPAARRASQMLMSGFPTKRQAQSPCAQAFAYGQGHRVPVVSFDGKKRTCLSAIRV